MIVYTATMIVGVAEVTDTILASMGFTVGPITSQWVLGVVGQVGIKNRSRIIIQNHVVEETMHRIQLAVSSDCNSGYTCL